MTRAPCYAASQTQQAEQMNKLWTHVLSTVQPECAQAVQNQMMAQQEGKQPLPLAEVSPQSCPQPNTPFTLHLHT